MRTMNFSYAFAVKNIPPQSKRVYIWVPIPQSDSRQNISDFTVTCSYPHSIYTEVEYGNSILRIEATDDIPINLPVSINFQVTRTGYQVLDEKHQQPTTISPESLKRFLSADRLVPIDGKISSEAQRVVQLSLPVLQKARALYDHVVTTMKYDKTGTGWGMGDAVFACDMRRGNCTDFHSLFIGLTRASGIPSRFVIGFPIPEHITQGDITGYHCWAEFYDDTLGWIPVDASEANKHLQKKEFYFGGLDANRVQFSVGRDVRLSAAENVEPQNYFIYPYILVDGKPFGNVEFQIRFSDLAE